MITQLRQTTTKNNFFSKLKTTLASSLLLLSSQASYAANALGHFSQTYTAAEIQADLAQWVNWLHSTHPDLTHSIDDIDAFYAQIAALRSSITTPMTGESLWRELAKLNATMADGHLSFSAGKYAQWREWVANGARLFPFEIAINSERLFIKSKLGGEASPFQGQQITHINGTPANEVLSALLKRTEGDNLAFRKALLSLRFPMIYRMQYGQQDNFEVTLATENTSTTLSLSALNIAPYSIKVKPFEHYFNLQLLEDQQAILTVKSFGWDEPRKYFQFMEQAFKKIKANNTQHLLIDISENTGGDDIYWMDGILKYIAQQPYKQGSHYIGKILAKYRDPGEVIGSVVTGSLTRMIQPEKNHSLLYTGKVSVITGPLTYSSAVLFANTIQDHQFAKLIGTPTGGRSTQSGGIQFLTLKNTQFSAVAPRFVLARPSGEKQMTPVQPDIALTHDALDDTSLIKQALTQQL